MFMDVLQKNRGAVSIFLLIVLLPTMAFVGIFIDLARVELSKEVAVSSADLVMNTVLSQYDKMLKENYGLFASGQNVNPKDYEDYFKACLISAGVSTNDAAEYASNIMELFTGEEGIADFLQVSGEDFKIGPAENGTLKNPAILKTQIVEFMKYRSPINAVSELFSKITDDSVSNQMQNLSLESELIEKREAFFKAENALIQQGKKAYEAIKKYEESSMATESALTELSAAYKSLAKNNSSLEQVYRDAHNILIKDLYTTHDASGNLIHLMSSRYFAIPQPVTTYNENNKAKKDNVKNALNDFSSAITSYVNASSALNNAWNNIGAYNSSNHYDVQYWVSLTKTVESAYNSYIDAANNLQKKYLAAENAVNNCDDKVLENKMKISNSYAGLNGNDESTYQEIWDSLSVKYLTSYLSEIASGGIGAKKAVDSSLNQVKSCESKLRIDRVNEIYSIRNTLNNYKDKLDTTKAAADNAKTQVDAMKELIGTYKSAYDSWIDVTKRAKAAGIEEAEQDEELIKEVDKTKLMEKITPEAVDELSGRLGNISNVMSTFSNAIMQIKYNGTSIVNIGDYRSFRAASKADASKIVTNKTNLESYADTSFNMEDNSGLSSIEYDTSRVTELELYASTTSGQTYIRGYRISLACTPELTKTNEPLYVWLKDKFGKGNVYKDNNNGYVEDNESSANEWNGKFNNKKGNEGEKADTSGNSSAKMENEIKNLPELPSGGVEDKFDLAKQLLQVSQFVSDLFHNFGQTFGKAMRNVRDHLFTIDYVMSMFTYDTFDEEGKFNLLSPEEKSNAISNSDNSKFADVANIWNNSPDKKTLTLNIRNSDNNYSYLNEVEYILYGSTNEENKNSTYGRIYIIRYALDLAPVFSNFFNDGTVEAIAEAIQALIYVPAPLTKTLICMGITAAEAAQDLKTLKKGIPLLLIKGKDDLYCSLEYVYKGGTSSGNTSKNDNRIRLQYSDYLCIFLFLKLTTDEDGIYLRIADTIQANMRMKNKDFTMSKAVVYYQMNVTMTVKPFLSQLLLFDNAGDKLSNKGWRTYKISMIRGY